MEIILASHGQLATGMKSAVEMILGEADFISCYDLCSYKTPVAIFNELKDVKDKVIITDIFGGSVNNVLLELMEHNILISGMNLGLVLEVCLHRNNSDLYESIEELIDETSKFICFVNREKNNYMGSDELW